MFSLEIEAQYLLYTSVFGFAYIEICAELDKEEGGKRSTCPAADSGRADIRAIRAQSWWIPTMRECGFGKLQRYRARLEQSQVGRAEE